MEELGQGQIAAAYPEEISEYFLTDTHMFMHAHMFSFSPLLQSGQKGNAILFRFRKKY